MIPILDGHNDTLTAIRDDVGDGGSRPFLKRTALGHLDLPRAREGGLAGGFFAVFTPSPDWRKERRPIPTEERRPVPTEERRPVPTEERRPVVDEELPVPTEGRGPVVDEDSRPVPEGRAIPDAWSVALPPKLDRRRAERFTRSVMSDLFRLVDHSDGAVEVVRSTEALRRCLEDGTFAMILHIEGAEAIDTRFESLDVLHAAGLRSLGPVWSRPNAFGHGVPFDFPRHPDTGPGLTTAGRRLVRRCNELGIMVDCSHLTAAGFWDVARISDAPVVATHSNAHALCASPRNLTDAQLEAVARSGGVVGLNYAVGFLREDGRADSDTPLSEIVRHARYIADLIGVEHLALGSDFDGAMIPRELGDVTGLPKLLDALREADFGEDELELISYGNWLRVVEDTWRV